MTTNMLYALATVTFAVAPAGAQQASNAAVESTLACEQISAELTAKTAEMKQLGQQAVSQAFAQSNSQRATSVGAAAAAAAGSVVPVAGLIAQGLVESAQAQAARALAEAKRRAEKGQEISLRLQQLQKLQSEQCTASASASAK